VKRRALAAILLALAVAVATALARAPHSRPATAQATAFARDDGRNVWGLVRATGTASRSHHGVSATTSAFTSTRAYRGSASASATVTHVSLLGGLVRARNVSVTATSGSVTSLVIDGRAVGSPTRRTTYGLPGYGKVIALDTPAANALVGLTVKLGKRYGRYPRGTVLRVAYASASAHDGVAPPPKAKPKPRSKSKKPPAKPTPKPKRRKAPTRTHVLLTAKGFVFPVYGKHNYSDTFGAARADTGTHEGNDIFAAAGTPVVAVCDGSLNRVGTLPISGNRLWVKCSKTGDAFFYAHLSAYATDTRDGLHVKAGQVVGFVGSTGDAENTPPHLHFEVHPGNRGAVDPYPFLRAWENRRDVPAAAWVRANGQTGQQPGTLVVVKDFLSQ
jgi:murein DD-endopeptidase MepM/ murein hydrolase activator NlpD